MQIIIIRAFSFDSLKKIVNFDPDYNKIALSLIHISEPRD